MSKLSTLLGQRVIEPHRSGVDAHPTTSLAELRGGQHAVIADVRGEVDAATARRMVDLGFAPGAQVQVLRRAPMADPVMFRIAGYEIALRRAQARCIRVVVDA